MKRNVLLIITLCLLFISCNASILMNNGEISNPDKSDTTTEKKDIFDESAPENIRATKSYYPDKIVIRWKAVQGADYYTIEKTVHDTNLPSDTATWIEIQEALASNTYVDSDNLEPSKYYSYRVTAHSLNGKKGQTSSATTGTIVAAPSNLSASKGESSTAINIVWDQMPYVDSYEIYKSESSVISGVKAEYVDVVSSQSGTTNAFAYVVSEKEEGKELYFAIKGVGPTGETSEISLPRSGYTFKEGSPTMPIINYISKGDSNSSITLKFKSSGIVNQYIIKRSSKGMAESTVYDSEFNGDLEQDENGYLIFEDVDVKQNIEYTYSIVAVNDIGMSTAGVATGYLLSPVQNLTLQKSLDTGNLGYYLQFSLPVGGSDSSRDSQYSYEIIETYKDGSTKTFSAVDDFSTSSDDKISSYIGKFYGFASLPTAEEELKELRNVSVKVSNSDGIATDFVSSESISDIPDPITAISASSNSLPKEGDVPNSYGVYPVHVSWETNSEGPYTLIRKGSDGTEVSFIVGSKSYIDTSTSSLVIYEYFVDASDELGRTFGEPHATNSYGAITFQTYKVMFESLSLKPWEIQDYVPAEYKTFWKNTDIAKMIAKGNASDLGTQTEALGSAEATDHFHGGQVKYNASMEGIGGQIYFDYTNFGENINWICNGSYEMHVNASGNGSAGTKTNGFNITGMYPGHIGIDNISVSGKTFVGSYTVTYTYSDGSKEEEVNVR